MKQVNKLVFVLFFLFAGFIINAQTVYDQSYKFAKALEWINNYYVDSVDTDMLVEKAIIEMLDELDPHSTYLTKEEVKQMNEPLEGNFEGIGISFNILKDTIFVVSPISGGPSERIGILSGDRIIEVEGKNVAGTGITNKDVFELLRGKKGTKVNVTVLRRGSDDILDFTITRDKIPIYSLDASYKVKDNIGYLKINRFSMTTIDEFKSAVSELKKEGVENLILDLTGNGGGYLEVAIKLADQFLKKDRLVVYTMGLNSEKREYAATSDGDFEDGKVVILIDEGSASASEIVSGAIQDWDRGVIIGRRSFGKGLVQRPLLLPDQSMIRLTIARYYTPSGRLIQKPYSNYEDYELELLHRIDHGELLSADSIQFPDSLKNETLISSRTVYGGGGIMPDYFIPIDTSFYSDYYRNLIRKGLLNQFILEYVDKNRKSLYRQYESFETFYDEFEIDEKLFSRLTGFAKEEGLKVRDEDISVSKEQIELLMKAYIARDLWNTNEFYRIMNDTDPKFNKALAIIEDWDNLAAFLVR